VSNLSKDVDIYKMKLHESVYVSEGPMYYCILRVAGGFIYECITGSGRISATFVPFSDEFMETKNDNDKS